MQKTEVQPGKKPIIKFCLLTNTREQLSEIMSQTPKQYHSTECLTIISSTNRIPCLKYQRAVKQTTSKTPKWTSVLWTDKYYREVDVPCKAQVCTISKDIHFVCIGKQIAFTIKYITKLASPLFMWKVENLGFGTEHLCGYFLLLITHSKISKNSYLLVPNHRNFQYHSTFQILVW